MTRILRAECCMDSKELVYVEMDFDDVGSHTYE